MTTATPLEDPAYQPRYPPAGGLPPDVVAKWGPRSQVRWFDRYRGQLRRAPSAFWDRFYCTTTAHRGNCCTSCESDWLMGYAEDMERCCCRAYPEE
jgi:hypothetical protein